MMPNLAISFPETASVALYVAKSSASPLGTRVPGLVQFQGKFHHQRFSPSSFSTS